MVNRRLPARFWILVAATSALMVLAAIIFLWRPRATPEYALNLPANCQQLTKNYGNNQITGEGQAWNYTYNCSGRAIDALAAVRQEPGFVDHSLEAGPYLITDNASSGLRITAYSDNVLHVSVGPIPSSEK